MQSQAQWQPPPNTFLSFDASRVISVVAFRIASSLLHFMSWWQHIRNASCFLSWEKPARLEHFLQPPPPSHIGGLDWRVNGTDIALDEIRNERALVFDGSSRQGCRSMSQPMCAEFKGLATLVRTTSQSSTSSCMASPRFLPKQTDCLIFGTRTSSW
jgi:hypothetical protein